jgi:hypothetical protein
LLQTFIANQKNNDNWLNRNSDQYNQLLAALRGTADIGALTPTAPQTKPVAPTVAASASAGVLNGAYQYISVLITGYKNSDLTYNVTGLCPSAEAGAVTITNKQGNLSAIGIGTGAAVIGRAIYRTAAAGATGTEEYCGIIWDNVTTTYTDNLADASLGTGMPTVSGTAIPSAVPTVNTTGSSIPANSAAAGSTLASQLAACVLTTGDQTVGGNKKFTNGISVGSVLGLMLLQSGTTLALQAGSYSVNIEADAGVAILNSNATAYRSIGASAFAVSSSARWKDNIKPFVESKKLLDIELKTFTYKPGHSDDGGVVHMGAIAEDIAKLFPDAVTFDAEGLPSGIDYSKLVVPCIGMIQQLEKRIEALENKK